VIRLLTAAIVALLALVPVAPLVAGDEEPPFRPGTERRTWRERPYDLILAKDFGTTKPGALVVVVKEGGGFGLDDTWVRNEIQRWERVVPDGWAVCLPKSVHHRSMGDNWSTSEAPEIAALARHLADTMSIGPGHIHLFGSGDVAGFTPLVAFAKDAPWRSACFSQCTFRGGPPADRAKSMGVLVLRNTGDTPLNQDVRFLAALKGRVGSLDEFPTDSPVLDPRFRWWLDAMDGRFVPGRDHSLPWADAPTTPDALRAAAVAAKRGAIVWFHDPADAKSDAARALHVDVFFDAGFREQGTRVLAFRAPIAKARELAAGLRVATSPALVVVDAKGAVVAKFEGAAKPADVAKAIRAVAGK
jgi:hypothetical protein